MAEEKESEKGQACKITRLDNDLFAELQEEYLKDRNPQKLTEMYFLIKRYMRRTFAKYCRKHNLVYNPVETEELLEDMTLQTIEQYLKHPEFKIERMSAYAHFGFVKVMYAPARVNDDIFFKYLNAIQEDQRNEIAKDLGITVIYKKQRDIE